jgi:linoleoyl-CoA desaturase
MGYKVTFNNKNKVFFNALKAEVDAYFERNGMRKTGNWKLYGKTMVLLPTAIAIYIALFHPCSGLCSGSTWLPLASM